jgi:soluble lytic murein transglycosylase
MTSKTPFAALFCLSVSFGGISMAAPLPKGDVPVPTPRPPAVSTETTSSVQRVNATASTTASRELRSGLDALSDRDVNGARAIRDSMRRGTLDRHILTWAIALSGLEGVPSGEIAAAAAELKDWPGLKSLRGLSERAMFFENPPAAQVLAAFGDTRPETVKGAITLTRALVARQARPGAPNRWQPGSGAPNGWTSRKPTSS